MNVFENPWKKWGITVALGLLVLAGVYGYEYAATGKVKAAYTVANSVRFVSGNSDNLSRTMGTPTNNLKWTLSTWIKRTALNGTYDIFGETTGGLAGLAFRNGSGSGDELTFYLPTDAWTSYNSTPLYRDPGTWINIVFVLDTANATAADRAIAYVNGIRQPASVSITQNRASNINANAAVNRVGDWNGTYFDGYMSDFYFVDGQALTPTSFGQYDANGYWRPISYAGTYGNNGFHLAFGNGASLGTDSSGNGNNWTVNNLVAADQVTDTPTSSFATLSPLWVQGAGTLSNGNLTFTGSGAGGMRSTGTIGLSGGKYCFEATRTVGTVSNEIAVGVHAINVGLSTSAYGGGAPASSGGTANEWAMTDRDTAVNNSTYTDLSGTLSQVATNVVVQVCVDMTIGAGSNKIWFGTNNTFSGSPSAGTGATFSNLPATVYPLAYAYGSGDAVNFNFGQGATTTTTFDSASGGYFRYALPAGFKALSTANLPVPAIAVPKNYFDALIYTGTGAATSTTWAQFQPDLVWLKDRTTANPHGIFDSVRTATKYWSSNASTLETTDAQSLTAFLTNGFSLGTAAAFNTSGDNYVAWLWKKSPIVDGVDIVTYTGDNTSNRNISHSLGAAPDMVIVKRRDSTGDPYVWTSGLTGATYFLKLDSTAAQSNTTPPWGTGNFSSTQFMVSNGTENINASGATYVAYLFKNIDGFSKVGTYTGNGNADGSFVYTGFKPKYIMIKRTDTTGSFEIHSRIDDINPNAHAFYTDDTHAEFTSSSYYIDFLSNGFKIRTTDIWLNASGGTYIYAAFADIPFYYSAQPASSVPIINATFLLGMTF